MAILLKENETLKRHYKELSDSIQITRVKTIEHTTYLIAQNAEFKAQLQERGFTIAALKNELRKLIGNSIVQICLWIIDSGCSKHMTGNRALLTNFVEKFLGTVRFGNNDFAVIAGYRDVVIGSMTIKKVYYVEGLGHNLFSVEKFCEKGLEVAFRKSTCFVQNEDGVDLFTGDQMASKQFSLEPGLSNLNEMGKSSNRSVSKVDEALKNDLEDLFQDFYDEYFDSSKIMKSSTTNVKTSINEEVFHEIRVCVNVNFDEISEMASKQFSLEPGLSNLNEMGKSSNRSVSKVDEALKNDLEDLFQDFYDEYFDSSKIMKSSTTNVKTSINEEVFHEVSVSFQGESSSSSLNDNVQQSPKEVILPTSNTQSILINMVPNGDEASTSHNVFNERLEDAYFDASISFHDPSNVQTFYQPYPHEKKWTKDHPLYKIIGDPKSSVRTRGQLANSCLLFMFAKFY
uniref:Integrase, catalytic region, zinc finger, CCHC-type, peptidase aspartic, catalytic n=1 Tax=Tanacetum cinerariifolium TaxID=118510 RepID=A0A699GJ33_TANCI|nr:integrase, catalytic region, zinc finger, CCHC-type, peptidase aspartic, catalytic [Tanacetum cinerariifolium]